MPVTLSLNVSIPGQPWTWPLLPRQWSRVPSAVPLSPTPSLPPSWPAPRVSPATPASPVLVSAPTHHTWQLHNNWVSAPSVTDTLPSSDVLMPILIQCIMSCIQTLQNEQLVFYEVNEAWIWGSNSYSQSPPHSWSHVQSYSAQSFLLPPSTYQ